MPISGPPGYTPAAGPPQADNVPKQRYDPAKIPTVGGSGGDVSDESTDDVKAELRALWKNLLSEGLPKPKPWFEFFAK